MAELQPGREVVFLAARSQDDLPGYQAGKGTLCLGQPLLRLGTGASNASGRGHLDVDPGALPFGAGHVAIQPGDTWWFQASYEIHDPDPTTNLTGSLRITFR